MSLYHPLFHALNHANVRYVVVGGLAVVLHGYARMTADIDLMLDLSRDETEKAIQTLLDYGLVPRAPVDAHDFCSEEKRRDWRKNRNMIVLSFWHPQQPMLSVDIFIDNPIDFNDVHQHAIICNISGENIYIAAIPDLINLKKISGRKIDLDDITYLEKIQAKKNEQH